MKNRKIFLFLSLRNVLPEKCISYPFLPYILNFCKENNLDTKRTKKGIGITGCIKYYC